MSRVQLSINVSDFDAAVELYSRLFGSSPASAAMRTGQMIAGGADHDGNDHHDVDRGDAHAGCSYCAG